MIMDYVAFTSIMVALGIVLWGFWPDLQDLRRGK